MFKAMATVPKLPERRQESMSVRFYNIGDKTRDIARTIVGCLRGDLDSRGVGSSTLVDDLLPLLLVVSFELEVTVVVRRTGFGTCAHAKTNKNLPSVLCPRPDRRTHHAGLTVVSQEEDRSHNRDKVQGQTQHVSDDPVYAHEPFPSDRLGDGLAELGNLSTRRGLGRGESAFLDELAVVL
jgi:hypothetical protein